MSMKRTYQIRTNAGHTVLGYFKTLTDAKGNLKLYWPNAEILMMRGPYFGEGFHFYKVRIVDGKFKRIAC